ncbi:MAG: ABC transporter ATP-binding protein, partial [Bacillota bacterium]|nr:ABC transporter ATP-binding protein [Bacillota bacterium]
MSQLLKIDNLIVSFINTYGEMTAVKGVSLHLDANETLALVGESGCGKTVLCKSMLKILCDKGRIKEGEILLEGKDLVPVAEKDMTAYRGGAIAMVFQDPMTSLDPAFSVGSQIAEVLKVHRGLSTAEAKQRAIQLMELVQIPDAEQRYGQRPYQFSGGMRQRIVIAIALAGEPKLLLADEPTTALDEETQEEIMKLLKDIQRKTGVAILFITHDLSLVEDIAQRVAIMKDGQLVEEGPVAEVFADPQHEYTRKLLGYLDYK